MKSVAHRLSYTEFFRQCPQSYRSFQDVVKHSENFGAELRQRNFFDNVKRVLSVGAGAAELETKAAHEFGFDLEVIEPASDYVERAKGWRDKLGLSESRARITEATFQEASPKGCFDLILFIHSWYAFSYDLEVLNKTLSLLQPGGKCFVTTISTTSLAWKIGDFVENNSGSNLSSESISAWMSEQGVKHDSFLNHRRIPEEVLVKGNELTPAGRDFVSFLSFIPWEGIEPEDRENLTSLVRSEVHKGIIDLKCGCLILTGA